MPADLIYDVGAHQGEDTEFYLALGYRVVAVEADPRLAERLRTRFADDPVEVIEGAVGHADATLFFVNRTKAAWGTTDMAWAERLARPGDQMVAITVPGVKFDNVIARHGCPFYMKIDIEGADLAAVQGLQRAGCRPAYVSLECGRTPWPTMRQELDALHLFGYQRFKIVRQGWHKPGWFHHRDGYIVHWTFGIESSGPFGADLPGRWLTYPQALRRYRLLHLLYATTGEGTWVRRHLIRRLYRLHYWHDLHASLA